MAPDQGPPVRRRVRMFRVTPAEARGTRYPDHPIHRWTLFPPPAGWTAGVTRLRQGLPWPSTRGPSPGGRASDESYYRVQSGVSCPRTALAADASM